MSYVQLQSEIALKPRIKEPTICNSEPELFGNEVCTFLAAPVKEMGISASTMGVDGEDLQERGTIRIGPQVIRANAR